MQKITSRFLSLDVQDGIKGIGIAAGSAVIAVIGESFSKGQFTIDLTAIWHVAAAAGLSFITHRFFSPATAVKPAQ